MRVAVVDPAGLVVTVVVMDDADGYDPGPGLRAVPDPLAMAYSGCSWGDQTGFVEPPVEPLTPEELATLKASLRTMIDSAAETERLKYITPGAGQAMTYQRKIEEARSASAEPEPDPADYPLLAASVGIDGPDVAAVAAVVLGMDAAWAQIGAAIEAVRLGTKRAINEALDEAAARAAANAAVWPA